MRKIITIFIFLITISFYSIYAEGEDMTVQKGKKVFFEYTLTVDGEVIDTSKGKAPLEYIHGDGGIIPGLSRELEGMSAGEEKNIQVLPEDGYGNVDPKGFQKVPKTKFPDDIKLNSGTILEAQGPDSQAIPVRIIKVEEEAVIVDFNHPLAGKSLSFDVKIVSVQ